MAEVTRELERSKAQNATEKALLEGARTTLATQNVASQQLMSNYVSEPEKFVTGNGSLDVAFQNYCTVSDSKVSRFADDF